MPPATARTLVKPAGTVHCPKSFCPQANTSPFSVTARLCARPAAMVTGRWLKLGYSDWPKRALPQATRPDNVVGVPRFNVTGALVEQPAPLQATRV